MPTTNSIGSGGGRDYTTISAWEAAIPSTPTGGYIGQCYNDAEFGEAVLISGHTTSAANFVKLTTATGQSFIDNAGAATLPLTYDVTKGVGVNGSNFNGATIDVEEDYVTIEKLQLKNTGTTYCRGCIRQVSDFSAHGVIQNCIGVVTADTTAGHPIFTTQGTPIVNCVGYSLAGGIKGLQITQGGTARNCTIINASGNNNGNAVGFSYAGTSNLINCLFIGWGTLATGTQGTDDYNATDLASGLTGAHDIFSLTPANELVSPTSDFRPLAGNHLQAGTRDQTYTNDLDIIGAARSTTTPTIGAREFITAVANAYARGPFTFHPGRSPGKSPVSGRFYRNRPAGPPSSTTATIIQQMLQLLGVGS